MVGFTIEFEDYRIPITLEQTVEEKEGVKHFYYGCSSCDSKIERKPFCPVCNKETTTVKVYPDGEPDEVGSRDMWDYTRVPLSDVELERVSSWRYIYTTKASKKKKLKASEIAKMKKLGKTDEQRGTTKDLYIDLGSKRQAIKCNVVFQGRINEAWIMPYPFLNKRKCLVMGIANGNKQAVNPTESFEELKIAQPSEEKIAVRTD
jgi:hypothetical protein